MILYYSQVFANEENIGYEEICNEQASQTHLNLNPLILQFTDMNSEQVLKLNGSWIRNIHHLAHLVDCKL